MLAHSSHVSAGSDAIPRGEIPSPREKSARRVVLVVDDEPLLLWSIAQALSANGFRVDEARDGRSALAQLASGPAPDAILLDLNLPDSQDLRLLAKLHAVAPSSRIVLMTAFPSPHLADEALREGAETLLAKPFDLDVLDSLLAPDAVTPL